jgi:hypothetical protein
MSKPWKVVNLSAEKIEIEREGERKELPRPSDKANLAVFLTIRPEEFLDEMTVDNFLTEKSDS